MNLKSLQRKWYKKLADTGFKDIENDKGQLKSRVDRPVTLIESDHISLVKENKAEYYRLANQFIFYKEFKSKEHQGMWYLHANGLSLSKIAQKYGVSRSKVRHRIDRMREKFYK